MIVIAIVLFGIEVLSLDLAFFRRLPLSIRLLAASSMIMILPVSCALIASWASGLTSVSVLIWQTLFTLIAAGVAWQSGDARCWREENLPIAMARSMRMLIRFRWSILTILLCVCILQLAAWLGTLVLTNETMPNRRDTDAVMYHLPIPCHWIQEGVIAPYESSDPRSWCTPINYEVLLAWYLVFSGESWSWARSASFWPVLSLCLIPFILLRLRPPEVERSRDHLGTSSAGSGSDGESSILIWTALASAAIWTAPSMGMSMLPVFKNDLMCWSLAFTGFVLQRYAWSVEARRDSSALVVLAIASAAVAGGVKSYGWSLLPFVLLPGVWVLIRRNGWQTGLTISSLTALLTLPWNLAHYAYVWSQVGNMHGPSYLVAMIQDPFSIQYTYTNIWRLLYRVIDLPFPLSEETARSLFEPLFRAVGADPNTPAMMPFSWARRAYFTTTGALFLVIPAAWLTAVSGGFRRLGSRVDWYGLFIALLLLFPMLGMVRWQWVFHDGGSARFFFLPLIILAAEGCRLAAMSDFPARLAWVLTGFIFISGLTVAAGHCTVWWKMATLQTQLPVVQEAQKMLDETIQARDFLPPGSTIGLVNWGYTLYFYHPLSRRMRVREYDARSRLSDPPTFRGQLASDGVEWLVIQRSFLGSDTGRTDARMEPWRQDFASTTFAGLTPAFQNPSYVIYPIASEGLPEAGR